MVPKSIGACADKLYKLKNEKSKLLKKVEDLETQEKEIKEHLINTLPKDEAKGVLGKLAKAVITTNEVPSAKDWPKFYKHVLKTKDFSLMQRRLSTAAVKEQWEHGVKIPGVESFTVVGVSITKL